MKILKRLMVTILFMLIMAGTAVAVAVTVSAATVPVPNTIAVQSVVQNKSNSVTIRWNADWKSDYYKVYHKVELYNGKTSKWTCIGKTTNRSFTYKSNNIEVGKYNYFTVRGYNKKSKKLSPSIKILKLLVIPDTPKLNPVDPKCFERLGKCIIGWEPVPNISGYIIYRREVKYKNGKYTYGKWTWIGSTYQKDFTYWFDTEPPASRCQYTVKAFVEWTPKPHSKRRTCSKVEVPKAGQWIEVN